MDYRGDKAELLEILRTTSFRSKGDFHLSSGKSSPYYIDCKMALSYPRARTLMGKLIAQLLQDDSIDAVGGLELGAYPLAAAVSDAIYEMTGRTVRVFVVRKQPKSHGLMKLIEGEVHEGDRALIVDDVTTSGGSVIKAIEGARSARLQVSRAILLIDREESAGKENIEAHNVKFDALYKLSDLLSKPTNDTERSDARPNQAGAVSG